MNICNLTVYGLKKFARLSMVSLVLALGYTITVQANSCVFPAVPQNFPSESSFEFAVVADQDYEGEEPPVLDRIPLGAARAAWLKIIDAINSDSGIDFTLYAGDIGSPIDGYSLDGYPSICDVANGNSLEDKVNLLKTFNKPLIYTPGDNEWSECYEASSFDEINFPLDPDAQLAKIRALTQADPNKSLGQSSQLSLIRHCEIPENVMFAYGQVLFLTLNIPAYNNCPAISYTPENGQVVDETCAEFLVRHAANLQWIEKGFYEANQMGLKAVVITEHADLYQSTDGTKSERPSGGPDGLLVTTDTGLGPYSAYYTIAGIPKVVGSISATAELVQDSIDPFDDACSPISNDLTGKFGFADFSSLCGSGTLVTNVEAAHPIATIIHDRAGFAYYGSPAQTVPAFAIGNQDGLELRAAIENNPNMVITATADLGDVDGAEPEYSEIVQKINSESLKYPNLQAMVIYGDTHTFRVENKFANRAIKVFTPYGDTEFNEGSLVLDTKYRRANSRWSSVAIDTNAAEIFTIKGFDTQPSEVKAPILNYQYGTSGSGKIPVEFSYNGEYSAFPAKLVTPTTIHLDIGEAPGDLNTGSYSSLVHNLGNGVGTFEINVPNKTKLLYIQLSADTQTDYDIALFRVTSSDNSPSVTASQVAYSELGNYNDIISIENPKQGRYRVFISGYGTPNNAVFTTTTKYWLVTEDLGANLVVGETPKQARKGDKIEVDYQWDNLLPNEVYMGAVVHQHGSQPYNTTFIRVQTD